MVTAALTGLISYICASFLGNFPSFFITFFAVIIFNIELLSLFKQINGVNILILTSIEAIITLFIWIKKNRPALKLKIPFDEIKKALMEDKALLILSGFLIFCIFISFILAVISPVNEPDAQGYHALRALFWAKDGFISHFETADVRCHSMPINSEIFYTWLLSIFKKDTYFGLLQFCSYFLVIISSFKLMDKIELKKKIWAILVFSSFAGVISQISSTQTDLTVGALLAASIFFIKQYEKLHQTKTLFFAALSMALAFGVKSTGVIASIPILIWFIFILKRGFIKFFVFLIFNFLIFSSYNYILNFINYGNFLGAKSAILGHGFWGGIKAVIANFVRYIFQFFDFSGFTIGFYLNENLIAMQNNVISLFSNNPNIGVNVGLNYTNIALTEQTLGFGILGFIVFLPCAIIALFKKEFRVLAFIFWGQLLCLSASIAYMVFSIRFITTFLCISIPILTLSYFRKMNLYKFFIILFMMFYLGYASLFLSQRPIFYLIKEYKKEHNLSLIQENMRDLNYKFYPSFNEALTMKNALLPICKNGNKIGIIISNGYMLYSAKYLEYSSNCSIETLNMLHSPNLEKYDFLITQSNLLQSLETINKNDIKTPIYPDKKRICYLEGFDNSREKRILSFHEASNALSASCKINSEYLKDSGFFEYEKIEAKIPKYLINREKETIKNITIWKKNL